MAEIYWIFVVKEAGNPAPKPLQPVIVELDKKQLAKYHRWQNQRSLSNLTPCTCYCCLVDPFHH